MRPRRLRYEEIPVPVRAPLESWLGRRVVETRSVESGFSPGVASMLRDEAGRRFFLKAVSQDINEYAAELHRREIAVMADLPPDCGAPRLLWSHDRAGWVLLLLEWAPGRHPGAPWTPADLATVFNGLAELSQALTPSPTSVRLIGETYGAAFRGWHELFVAADQAMLERLDLAARRNLALFAELEAGWEQAAAGTTLLHGDLRSDNILLTDSGIAVVDWPYASLGAAWFDVLFMLPSVRMEGGPAPEELFVCAPQAEGADPGAVTRVLAAVTGFFVTQSLLPAPPGLPTLREFQAAQGEVALAWLLRRLASGSSAT
jgi:aminoglycoside phosphotransferase (APT) family kinase protein